MKAVLILVVSLWAWNANAFSDRSFPDNFLFGTGSSAYQIEGAWAENGKGENIWDHAIHANKSIIEDGTNADDADKSYNEYDGFRQDLDALVELNVSHYKLSLSWSRIFPDGVFTDETTTMTGLGHYQTQINELLENNIVPIVTLYHWDLPQKLQETGGWTNETIIANFVEYARWTFKTLFNVKYFITFNEPKQICRSGYGDGTLAPFVSQSGVLDYQCAYVVLKAHAAVYKMYKEEFAKLFEAKISMALDGSWSIPKTDSDADKEATERRNQFEFGLYANPLINGDWPAVVIERVKERSEKENKAKSRLPEFTDDEKKAMNGSIDFLALNFYDTRLITDAKEGSYVTSSYQKDVRVNMFVDSSWSLDAAGNTIVPTSIRSFLKYIKDNYRDPEILITGNGIADTNGTIEDEQRVHYLFETLSNVLDAIYEDEVNVFGYTYWSLLDSFEWTRGHKPHYGLYGIDFAIEYASRIPKKSVDYYKSVIQDKKLVDPRDITTTSTTTTPLIITNSTMAPHISSTTKPTKSTTDQASSTITHPTTPSKADLCGVSSTILLVVFLIEILFF